MFRNIGDKIKTAAAAIAIVLSILFIIYGFSLIREKDSSGIMIVIIGPICSWVGSFAFYGLGELIECIQSIDYKFETIIHDKNIDSDVIPYKIALYMLNNKDYTSSKICKALNISGRVFVIACQRLKRLGIILEQDSNFKITVNDIEELNKIFGK